MVQSGLLLPNPKQALYLEYVQWIAPAQNETDHEKKKKKLIKINSSKNHMVVLSLFRRVCAIPSVHIQKLCSQFFLHEATMFLGFVMVFQIRFII